MPVPAVTTGFGVDTTITDVGEIVRLTRAYLSRPDSTARARGLWSVATAFDRRAGDLTTSAYQGFPATIIGVVPAPGASDSGAYVVKLLYATADSSGHSIKPLALQRLYAVPESGGPFRFRLSGALARTTRDWQHRTQGIMTFWYSPGQTPNPHKILQATRFVDSVASLFGVPLPDHRDVYITASTDEAQRAIGLDFFPEASGPGGGHEGLTLPHGFVLVGNPAIGEAYLHEFVHVVLTPAFPGSGALFGEGVATWLGGSQGRTPAQMYALLHTYQEQHPRITIAALLHDDPDAGNARTVSDALYATDALIVDAVYARSGIPGLRSLARLGRNTDSTLAALPATLGLDPSNPVALDDWWRRAASLRADQPLRRH